MSMISITFQGESGGKKYSFDPTAGRKLDSERLKSMMARASNLSPAMEHSLKLMALNEEKLFLSEGASVGAKWRGYTSAERRWYIPYKRKMLGVELPMLRWSRSNSKAVGGKERLYPSMVMKPGSKGREYIAKASKFGFEYGSRVPWAKNHQRGTGNYKGKYQIPKRTILKMSDETMRWVVKTIQAQIMGGKFTVPR